MPKAVQFEVNAIVCFRTAFELSLEEVRKALAECDMGCPFGHYTKYVDSSVVCYTGDYCTSNFRILRAASTHFPVLRRFLANVTEALSAHRVVFDI